MSKVRIVTGKAKVKMINDDQSYKLKQVSVPKGPLKKKKALGMGAAKRGGRRVESGGRQEWRVVRACMRC